MTDDKKRIMISKVSHVIRHYKELLKFDLKTISKDEVKESLEVWESIKQELEK